MFNIISHPINQLDLHGLNLMNKAVTLESTGINRKFGQIVNIRMKYDLSYLKFAQMEEKNLTIYTVYGNYFRHPNIYPIGECCVDCDCQSVIGCICEGGTFVVGEN